MPIESLQKAQGHALDLNLPPKDAVAPPALDSLTDSVLLLEELLNKDIPEPEFFIAPFLARGNLAMVFAKRGVGKTWFLLELGLSLAKGSNLFSWEVPAARKVLYIDGEMSLGELKSRLEQLAKGKNPQGFSLLPSELLHQKGRPLNINSPIDQERINALVKESNPDVLILDNLSSLSSGRDENSNSEVDSILQWLISLRHNGIAVIIAHHAGKNNEQRGASRLEDILDTTIRLNEVAGITDGASFKIDFTKTRGKKPVPFQLEVTLIDSGDSLDWEYNKTKPPPNKIVLLQHINEGQAKTQKDIVTLMDKDKGYISNLVKSLKAEGYLEDSKKLTITPKGKAELKIHSADNNLTFNDTEYYDDNL